MKTQNTAYSQWLKPIGLAVALLLPPFAATAHDGTHVTRIVSDVEEITVHGARVGLQLMVSNFSEDAVVLKSISAQGADASAISPVKISPGDRQSVDVQLFFLDHIPGIFTAVLDFGEAGQGPVLVLN